MDVLLINPNKFFKRNVESRYKDIFSRNPISNGLLSIAGSLISKGHNVDYLDMFLEGDSIKRMDDFQGDLIGITSDTPNYPYVLDVLKHAKDETGAEIAIGGPHVTFMDIEALRNDFVDYVVRGEGEKPMESLCSRKPLDVILGLSYKDHDIIVRNQDSTYQDLNSLPMPAYELIPKGFRSDTWNIVGSKGCPFRCNFCVEPAYNGSAIRNKSIARIIHEIKEVENFGAKRILFDDNTFSLMDNWVRELSKAIKRYTNIEYWECDTRVDKVSENLLMTMKDGGCGRVSFGMESGSERMLKTAGKGTTRKMIEDSCRIAKKSGLKVQGYFIVGLPGENHDSARENIGFAESLKARDLLDEVSASVFVPYPGSIIFEKPEKYGIRILTSDWSKYYEMGFPVFENKDLSAQEIYDYWKELNAINKI
jgi:radical SAM superfamily enzyme YgiQ (UPF0313 family)